jgi:DNA-binding FadR family transcriptional regulator
MIFEPACSVMAMELATEEDLAAIEETVRRFEAVTASGSQSAGDDIAFHQAILKATHNPYVIFALLDFPFLYDNREQIKAVMYSDLVQKMNQNVIAKGMRIVATVK